MREQDKLLLTKELFAPIVRKFDREKIITYHVDDIWSADLIDKSNISKYNKGYKFILTVIDIFSKYAWAIALKNKNANTVTEAFSSILEKSQRKPGKLWTDKGKEFYNNTFLTFLHKNNIEIYSTESELKAVFIERFSRTLQDKLKIPMYIKSDANWVSILDDIVDKYNNTVHSTTKMTPLEGTNPKNRIVINRGPKVLKQSVKFKIGDYVRIPDKKKIFTKGYMENWGWELFKIHKILPGNVPTYIIEDEKGEVVTGKFYAEELLKSNFDFQRNRKVLRTMNIEI